MLSNRFAHFGICFGIVVDDWGNARGAEIAAACLKEWVKGLDRSETAKLYSDLIKSDTASGGDPIFETPAMLGLYNARVAARQEGLLASETIEDGQHNCNCNLIPMPDDV